MHRYVAKSLGVAGLAGLAVRETIDEVELANGIVILNLPCSASATRGLAVRS